MSRGFFKLKKYKQTEIKSLEASLRGAGRDNLHYEFGDDLVEYAGDSYLLDQTEERIKSLYLARNVRKDAVYMIDVLVTADKDFFDKKEDVEIKQFFHDCFIALSSFLGSDESRVRGGSIVSAVVDLSGNPCMHFCFVPITTDGKLSAKKIINTKMLFSLKKTLFSAVFEGKGLCEDSKSELSTFRNENSLIRNENTNLLEEKRCLMFKLEGYKNGSDQLKRLDAEFRQISNENSILRDTNLELLLEICDLQGNNKKLQEQIDKLEMKNSASGLGDDPLEMKNISQIDPKSWTAVLMAELGLLRLGYDYLYRVYVKNDAGIDALPTGNGKEILKKLREHYKKRGGKVGY